MMIESIPLLLSIINVSKRKGESESWRVRKNMGRM